MTDSLVSGDTITTTSPPSTPPAAGAHPEPAATRGSRLLVFAIIFLTSVLLLATALGTWVRRQALDTDAWTDASSEVLADPVVQEALAAYLVNQLYESVDVAAELQQRLPDPLDGLAAPLAGALREPSTQAVERLLASPQVHSLWEELNRRAHAVMVRILKDESRAGVSTAEGEVTLEVGELIRNVGQRLGLPAEALERIPSDAGHITLIQSDQLADAQRAVRLLERLSAVLFVVVVGLFALAVYLAKGWRRSALRNVGLALVLVGLAVVVIRRLGGQEIVDAVRIPENRDAGRAVWMIGTELLADIARNIVAVGVLVVLYAVLAGPSRAARRIRMVTAPILEARPAMVWAGLGIVFLLLVLWQPLPVLGTWYGFLIGGLLLAGGAEALRRQCLLERAAAAVPLPADP